MAKYGPYLAKYTRVIHTCIQKRSRQNEFHIHHSGTTSVLHERQLRRRISLELVQELKTFVFNSWHFLLTHNVMCHKYLTLLSLSFPLLLNGNEASWSPFSHCLYFLISVYNFHWFQCVHLEGERRYLWVKEKRQGSFCFAELLD